jgi:hypothetical protein
VFAIVAAFYLQRLIYLLTKSHFNAIAGSLLLCTGFTFWTHATEAEVYSLNLAFHLSATYYFLVAAKTKQIRWLYLACLIYAVSFGNHLLMITMLPSIIFLTWKEMPGIYRKPQVILMVSAFVLLGASQYYYIWHLSQSRSPWLEFIGYQPTFERFLGYITGRQFHGHFETPTLEPLKKFLRAERKDELNIIIMLLAPITTWLHWKSANPFQKRATSFLLLQMAALGCLCLLYAIPDINTYYLPLTACIIVLVCLPTATARYNVALSAILVASIVYGFVHNLTRVVNAANPFNDRVTTLRASLPPSATVYSSQGISIGHYGGFQGHSVWNHANLDLKKITFAMSSKDLKEIDDFYFLIEDYPSVENENAFEIKALQETYLLKDILHRGPIDRHARIITVYNPSKSIISALRKHFAQHDALNEITRHHSFAAIQQAGHPPTVKADRKKSSNLRINTDEVTIEAVSLANGSDIRWQRHNGYYTIDGEVTPLHCSGINIIDIALQNGQVANYYCLNEDQLNSESQPLRLFHAKRH